MDSAPWKPQEVAPSLPEAEPGESETPRKSDPQKPADMPQPRPWQGLGTWQGFAIQSRGFPAKSSLRNPSYHCSASLHLITESATGRREAKRLCLPAERILLCLNIILEIFLPGGWGQAGWAPRAPSCWCSSALHQTGFFSLFHSGTWLPNLATGAPPGTGFGNWAAVLTLTKI